MAFDPLDKLNSLDTKTVHVDTGNIAGMVTVSGLSDVAQNLTLKAIVTQMESLHEDLSDIKQLLFELLQIQDVGR